MSAWAGAAGVILLDIDPNIVRPGWMPGIILMLLLGAVVLLYFSLRKQLRKIDVPDDHRDDAEAVDPSDDEARVQPEASSPRSD